MALKNDKKFKEELICQFKTDMRNLMSCDSSTWKSVFIIFKLKKYRGVMFDGTEYWCKIWRKTDLYFLKLQ